MNIKNFLNGADRYITENKTTLEFAGFTVPLKCEPGSKGSSVNKDELESFVKDGSNPSFSEVLFGFVDKSGMSDSEIYKAAGVDRRVFSKIRCYDTYIPKKKTIIAICMAMELSRDETDTVLRAAGYTLSNSDTFDLIIMYCIENKIYSIAEINIALEHYNLELFNTEE